MNDPDLLCCPDCGSKIVTVRAGNVCSACGLVIASLEPVEQGQARDLDARRRSPRHAMPIMFRMSPATMKRVKGDQRTDCKASTILSLLQNVLCLPDIAASFAWRHYMHVKELVKASMPIIIGVSVHVASLQTTGNSSLRAISKAIAAQGYKASTRDLMRTFYVARQHLPVPARSEPSVFVFKIVDALHRSAPHAMYPDLIHDALELIRQNKERTFKQVILAGAAVHKAIKGRGILVPAHVIAEALNVNDSSLRRVSLLLRSNKPRIGDPRP